MDAPSNARVVKNAERDGGPHEGIGAVVRRGLSRPAKALPPVLFYDREGSLLFEQITELPEYYVTRAEDAILRRDAAKLVSEALRGHHGPVAVLELGAGTASKTGVLLQALARGGRKVCYFPADISAAPLDIAKARLARQIPQLTVTPIVGPHDAALARVASLHVPVVVLFIGSSIGNYGYADAVSLLGSVRSVLGPRGSMILGTDLRKPLDVLLPAYDDAAGVTAAFNKNVLARINRELGGRFVIDSFRHVAEWNEAESRIDMFLESEREQRVRIDALDLEVRFARGERIHTESSHKYNDEAVDRMMAEGGLVRTQSFLDERGWFAVHVAHARAAEARRAG